MQHSISLVLVGLVSVFAVACGVAVEGSESAEFESLDEESVASTEAALNNNGGPPRKMKDLTKRCGPETTQGCGYTCEYVAGFYECTKEGEPTYYCDLTGHCESVRVAPNLPIIKPIVSPSIPTTKPPVVNPPVVKPPVVKPPVVKPPVVKRVIATRRALLN